MKKLLIADSDQDSREHVTNLLQNAGYRVTSTNSVADALNDTLRKRAEVIILGESCDEISALVIVQLLKKCNRHIPIILLSSLQSLAALRNIRMQGIFYHARKSFEPEAGQELVEAVRSAISNFLRTEAAVGSY